MGEQAIYDSLCEHYGQVARQEDSQHRRERYAKVAAAFGYAADDLAALPDGANLGVSCGNPLVVAGLKEVCLCVCEMSGWMIMGVLLVASMTSVVVSECRSSHAARSLLTGCHCRERL